MKIKKEKLTPHNLQINLTNISNFIESIRVREKKIMIMIDQKVLLKKGKEIQMNVQKVNKMKKMPMLISDKNIKIAELDINILFV